MKEHPVIIVVTLMAMVVGAALGATAFFTRKLVQEHHKFDICDFALAK